MSDLRLNGALAEVTFDRFDLDSYGLFLRAKKLPESQLAYEWETDRYTLTTPARFAALLGAAPERAAVDRLPLAGHLFDYQRWIAGLALDAERFALWADTGLGKTAIALEWIRQVAHLTGGRVLILVPTRELARQWGEEAARFYGGALADWCKGEGQAVGVATYAAFVPGILPELRYVAGVVADESSILKTGGGTIKWNLIKSARGIRYKLSATATPAPNDTMEYASQAAFLEKLRTEGDILWTYFSRDKRGNWRIKPHAQQAFYRFMSSWSIYLRDPVRFGFADILSSLPEPDIREYRLEMTPVQREWMQGFLVRKNRGFLVDDRMGVQERSKLSQLAKGFLYDGPAAKRQVARIESPKPGFVADLARADVAEGRRTLIWTVFDAESAIVAEQLRDAPFAVATLDGSMSDAARANALDRFKAGEAAVLISKAQLIGYGLNLQHATSQIFSGWDDSFERLYQAIRRSVRFGQRERVRVHIPYIPELEGLQLDNVRRKQAAFDRDTALMERFYREALEGLAA